ncbi:MAG: CAP domain-containing protein [Ancrocorticia sp.]
MNEHSPVPHSFCAPESSSSPREFRRIGTAGGVLALAAGLLVVAPVEAMEALAGPTASVVESAPRVDDGTFESTELWPGTVAESPYFGSRSPEVLDNRSAASTNASTNASTKASPLAISLASFQQEVLRLVNIERANAGVAALVLDPGLNSLSSMWSDWMATTGEFGHLPSKYGWSLWGAVGAGGLTGENIAAGYSTPADVVTGWMNSTGHRQNILNPSFTMMGLGCSESDIGYGIYWTQQFAGRSVTKSTKYQKIPIPTSQITPVITGDRVVDSVLTFSQGGKLPPNTSLSYQWQADGKAVAGATKRTFKLTPAQSGKRMGLVATASNDPVFYNPTVLPLSADTQAVTGPSLPGPVSEWVNVDGAWYYYGADGVIQTGWISVGDTWYYSDDSGIRQTGWLSLGGKWYYLGASGAMQTGWVSVGGTWYYMNASGVMQTGWLNLAGKWYYLNAGGAMQTGWVTIGGTWYYMNSSGVMLTGEQVIGGKRYVFASNGALIS